MSLARPGRPEAGPEQNRGERANRVFAGVGRELRGGGRSRELEVPRVDRGWHQGDPVAVDVRVLGT
jgi:hypothetical protein